MSSPVINSAIEITEALESRYSDDPHCLELLVFFNQHPRTRFSRLVLVHALNNGKASVIDRALKRLVKDGLVMSRERAWCIMSNIWSSPLYLLSSMP